MFNFIVNAMGLGNMDPVSISKPPWTNCEITGDIVKIRKEWSGMVGDQTIVFCVTCGFQSGDRAGNFAFWLDIVSFNVVVVSTSSALCALPVSMFRGGGPKND